MHKQLSVFLMMIFGLAKGWAQPKIIAENFPYYRAVHILLNPSATQKINGFEFSSFAIETYATADFDMLQVVVNKLDLKLQHNKELDRIISVLYVINSNEIQITNTGQTTISFIVHLHFAPELSINPVTVLASPEGLCPKPPSVPGSLWRSGLPAPKPNPTSTQAKFCIVHHSAGSNTDTNYTNTVRNIFLYHTQTNGWDDIGYNFLIAKNGTIFDGRDPQGVSTQDNVQGAHFCGKNGGTMGTCLLGEFSTLPPFPAQLLALEELLAWKISKEALAATDSAQHPIGLSGFPTLWLYRISGHRDGFDGSHCNTECPGDSTWAGLNTLRYKVGERIRNCVIAGLSGPQNSSLQVFPNPANSILELNSEHVLGSIVIFNQIGHQLLNHREEGTSVQIDISNFPAGIYYINVSGHHQKFTVIK